MSARQDSPQVVIIGAGAGGGACAWALAQAKVPVLVLEAGPRYDPTSDYRLDRNDWEQGGFPAKVPTEGRQTVAPLQDLDPQWRDLRSWNRTLGNLNTGTRRRSVGYQHAVGVGGSTLRYTGEAHRLNPAAFRMRSRFGVGADWPLSYEDLEPLYAIAEKVVGVSGPAGDDARCPRSAPYPLPPHAISYAGQRVAQGCRALGLSFLPNPVAALSAIYDDRPPCNYCGNCANGCSRQDKGSTDLTFLRHAEATDFCEVRPESTVVAIETGPGDRVVAVRYVDAGGAEHRVATPALVLAAGVVETPRLMLLTRSAQAPDGLGNETGQVGRHFMETLSCASTGLHPEPLGSHRGLPSDGICWDFNAPDAIPGVIGGARFAPAHHESGLHGPIAYARRVVGGWGAGLMRGMVDTFGRVLSVGAIGESLPNDRSFIDLDPAAKDAHGLAKARIHSHLEDEALHRLTFMMGKCREILRASGVDTIFEEISRYDLFGPTHVFGTCRMGTDSADSVTDAWGRCHAWKNLFVADASLFPSTGGGEAPSLTVHALALRVARHVADRGRRGEL
ncbi:MAG: GMC family oxidoreductase [Rhodobacterales bacterium]|nr:GMC family oxidoreductase [Rhodobacterales bacterium]